MKLKQIKSRKNPSIIEEINNFKKVKKVIKEGEEIKNTIEEDELTDVVDVETAEKNTKERNKIVDKKLEKIKKINKEIEDDVKKNHNKKLKTNKMGLVESYLNTNHSNNYMKHNTSYRVKVTNRTDLAPLVETLERLGIKFKVSRSKLEGFRYQVAFNEKQIINEAKEEDKEEPKETKERNVLLDLETLGLQDYLLGKIEDESTKEFLNKLFTIMFTKIEDDKEYSDKLNELKEIIETPVEEEPKEEISIKDDENDVDTKSNDVDIEDKVPLADVVDVDIDLDDIEDNFEGLELEDLDLVHDLNKNKDYKYKSQLDYFMKFIKDDEMNDEEAIEYIKSFGDASSNCRFDDKTIDRFIKDYKRLSKDDKDIEEGFQKEDNDLDESLKGKYYDFEYDRYVDEDTIRKQYNDIKKNDKSFNKSYEQFKEENFVDAKDKSHVSGLKAKWSENSLNLDDDEDYFEGLDLNEDSFITDKGRDNIKQAKENKLLNFYDEHTGTFTFSPEEYEDNLDKIKKWCETHPYYGVVSQDADIYDLVYTNNKVYFLTEIWDDGYEDTESSHIEIMPKKKIEQESQEKDEYSFNLEDDDSDMGVIL